MEKGVTWDITSKCNLRCKHCYNSREYFNKKKDDLSFDDCKKVINFLEKNEYKNRDC